MAARSAGGSRRSAARSGNWRARPERLIDVRGGSRRSAARSGNRLLDERVEDARPRVLRAERVDCLSHQEPALVVVIAVAELAGQVITLQLVERQERHLLLWLRAVLQARHERAAGCGRRRQFGDASRDGWGASLRRLWQRIQW